MRLRRASLLRGRARVGDPFARRSTNRCDPQKRPMSPMRPGTCRACENGAATFYACRRGRTQAECAAELIISSAAFEADHH